ncbi:MAG: ParB/RepB/Spo0J family partition protein [Treponemataceae bacterium]|nr:ParB/RepB/Spo0J family partition protein [Treponemataceae bacterium]
MAKNALGKGLGALLQENDIEEENSFSASSDFSKANNQNLSKTENTGVIEIELDKIKANPYQPRKEFSQEELSELADSIKEHGVIEPIILTQNPDGGYFIVGGERRTRACRLAGLTKIPAVIKSYTPQKMLEIALIENIQREDLNSLEEALAYQQLMEMENLSQEELAKIVGKKRSTVANSLRLLKLPQDMQRSLAEGKISAGHARAILSVLNPSDQQILYARILGSEMSVRDAEKNAAELNGGGKASVKEKTKETVSKKDPDILDFEQKLIDKFGTKVLIKGSLEKGSIQFEYFSGDDLDRLYSLLLDQE